MNMPLVLLNRRRRGGSFSPYSLFSGTAIGTWFDPSDLSTMYQDAAGTTAVTTPGQPVGLRLDKSKGLALGAELVANGDFSGGTTGWTPQDANVVLSTSGGSGVATYSATSTFYQAVSVQAGKAYRATAIIKRDSGSGTLFMNFRSGATLVSGLLGEHNPTGYTSASYTFASAWFVAASTGTVYLHFPCSTTGSTVSSIDNISVKELPGNHATQSVLASRPVYGIEPAGGRRNLLTWTEAFNEGTAWTLAQATITANAIAAPDGTTTAELLLPTAVPNLHGVARNVSVAAGSYCISVYAKAQNESKMMLWSGATGYGFDLSNGTTSAVTGYTAPAGFAITPVGSGWYRCSITVTAAPTENTMFILQNFSGASFTGNASNGIYIWGAQLELGTTATNYQRVTTAFDVTEAGVQTCHYVQYDGSDDGMITNSIDFTATDKMSVFTGMRTNSNGGLIFAELSANSFTNAGSFLIGSGSWVQGGNRIGGGVTGSTLLGYDSPATFTFPLTATATHLFDIAGATASAEAALRINGAVQSLSYGGTGAAGTGNFGNYKLNLGRRGNDQATPTLPFFGRDYGIVVVGKATTAAEITSTESWLAGKTGFYAPIITGVPTIGVS